MTPSGVPRWLRTAGQSIRTGLWAVPGTCVAAAVALAAVLVHVDRASDGRLPLTFRAGPDGAREVLSSISSSMITFTGLVFSIPIVVLQLTSSQFSPRVLRTFLRDRKTQFSLGIFVATFVYAMIVLRSVSNRDDAFVPAAATTVALGLLLLSVGVFVSYIHHIATAIQVTSILASIGAETARTLESRYPANAATQTHTTAAPPPAAPVAVLTACRPGVVTHVDTTRLVALAEQAGVLLRLHPQVGDFVPEGAPLVDVVGDGASLAPHAVTAAVTIARDRTMQQDVGFGIRQLVDIGARALSPGVNDPTTAVQALDQLHDILRRLASRPLCDGRYSDGSGVLRLVARPETFQGFAELALQELEQYGAGSAQVLARIRSLRQDVGAAALAEHRAAPALRPR